MCLKELIHWQQDDVDDLSEVLRVFPDATPCDLAIMVHKPCMEVRLGLSSILVDFLSKAHMDDQSLSRFSSNVVSSYRTHPYETLKDGQLQPPLRCSVKSRNLVCDVDLSRTATTRSPICLSLNVNLLRK